MHHHRIRTDTRSITYNYWTDDLGPAADEDVVAQAGTLALLGANCHLVFDVHVLARVNCAVDDDALGMDEHQTRAEFRAATDDALAEYGVHLVEQHLCRRQPRVVGRLHEPIQDDCQCAVAEQRPEHLPGTLALVVPASFGTNVLSQCLHQPSSSHHQSHRTGHRSPSSFCRNARSFFTGTQ